MTDREIQTLRNLGHDDAANEIERLRAALEVSQAATAAAVNTAQWQARTNTELNALDAEVRRLRANVCRQMNEEFGGMAALAQVNEVNQ